MVSATGGGGPSPPPSQTYFHPPTKAKCLPAAGRSEKQGKDQLFIVGTWLTLPSVPFFCSR